MSLWAFLGLSAAFVVGWVIGAAVGYANGRSDQARLDEAEIADARERLADELRKDVTA